MHNKQFKSIINIILFTILLLWNTYQPLVADDFGRAYADVLKNNNLLSTIHHQYYTWTGRISAEILAYFFLSKSHLNYFIPLINFINSVILVALLNVLYKLAYGRNYTNSNFVVFSLLYLIYFLLIGTFSQDFLWKTVALQYEWGLLVLLAIIWRFCQNLELKQNSTSWAIIVYTISGIFIGFYNEIYIAFVADLYITIFIVWILFKKPLRDLAKIQYIIFLLAVLISGIISIKAPGNFVRQQTYILNNHIPQYNLLIKLFMTYVQFFRYGYHIAFGVILLWIAIWTYKYRKTLPQNLLISLTFLLILLNIHILSFVEVAYYSPISGRMLIFIDSIIFLIFFKFFEYKLANVNLKYYHYCFYAFSLIIIIYVSFAYYELHKFNVMREQLIAKRVQNDLTLPKYEVNFLLKYPIYFDDITTDKNDFRNISLAKYYGLNSVTSTDMQTHPGGI